MKEYNFDKIIDRTEDDNVKYGLRKLIFNNENVIPLWVADMDFETPDFIINAMRNRVNHAVFGYGFRSPDYNRTIRNWVSNHYNWKVRLAEISFSPGVVPGLVMSILAFTKPGDKILVQPPVYFPFFTSISGNNRELVLSPLKNINLDYQMDFDDLEAKFKMGVKMFIMSNPHNPVGRVWTLKELHRVVDLCEKYDVLILSDEIHADLAFEPNVHIPIASISKEASKRTLTFMAASKTFNIAGLSTAFVIIQQKELLKEYDKTMEAMHLFPGNVMGTVATKSAFENGDEWRNQMLDYVKGNIDFVADYSAKHIPKLRFNRPQATYLLWLDFRAFNRPQKDLVALLVHKAGVGLNDGTLFMAENEGFMRMNVACPRQIVQQALEQIREALKLI